MRTVFVAVLALVLVVALSCVSAMSARDAYEEARKHHKHDPNFNTNYNPEIGPGHEHPRLKGGHFGPIEAPVYDLFGMPHAPGRFGRGYE